MSRLCLAVMICLLLLAPAAPSVAAAADDSAPAVAVLRAGPDGLRVERHVARSTASVDMLLRDLRGRRDVVAADIDVPVHAEGLDPLRS
ncbi:MAG: hypothetical protein M3N52_13470, partial [Actinomycetota bacterium]|nr:hypothetical protein [Actinomycetota bacterium]